MRLTLIRQHAQPASCTLGALTIGGATFWTLERPWVPDAGYIGGAPGRSCVPAGVYKLLRHQSEAHPYSLALSNPALGVTHWGGPGLRGAVLIHAATHVEELRGCVALGMLRSEESPGRWALIKSRLAMDHFKSLVAWVDGHEIEIIQAKE